MLHVTRAPLRRPAGSGLVTSLAAPFRTWWQYRVRQRRIRRTVATLRALDDRALADIGLRRDDILSAVREKL